MLESRLLHARIDERNVLEENQLLKQHQLLQPTCLQAQHQRHVALALKHTGKSLQNRARLDNRLATEQAADKQDCVVHASHT